MNKLETNMGAVVRLSANELRWLINQLEGRSKDHVVEDYVGTATRVLKALESEEVRVTAAIKDYVDAFVKGKVYTSEELKQVFDDREK